MQQAIRKHNFKKNNINITYDTQEYIKQNIYRTFMAEII